MSAKIVSLQNAKTQGTHGLKTRRDWKKLKKQDIKCHNDDISS